MMRTHHLSLLAACWMVLGGCSSEQAPLDPNDPNTPGGAGTDGTGTGDAPPNDAIEGSGTGSEDNTHHHQDGMGSEGNPNATNVEEKRNDEELLGGISVVPRLHACGKLSINTFTNVLRDLGVNVESGAELTAGQLLRDGRQALGQPSYRARIPEAAFPTTAAMTKFFDIFVLAAGEIRQNLASSATCEGVTVLDEDGKLTRDAASCIIGVPASAAHVQLANMFVGTPEYEGRDSDAVDIGIAALLSTHQLCE